MFILETGNSKIEDLEFPGVWWELSPGPSVEHNGKEMVVGEKD